MNVQQQFTITIFLNFQVATYKKWTHLNIEQAYLACYNSRKNIID
jgi:hypothetical protein